MVLASLRLAEAESRAPSGHPDRCLVRISLILFCRVWSKLDAQVVVCVKVGDPSKAWVSVVYSSTVPTVNPFAFAVRRKLFPPAIQPYITSIYAFVDLHGPVGDPLQTYADRFSGHCAVFVTVQSKGESKSQRKTTLVRVSGKGTH